MRKLLVVAIFVPSTFALDISQYINKKNCSQVVEKPNYQVCYDYSLKGSKYVAYTVDGQQLITADVHIKKRPNFYPENSIPVKYRSYPEDYTRTGYDRGHMANHADFDYSANLVYMTYSMANIVPQDPEVNRHTWVKAEKYERTMAKKMGTVNVLNIISYTNQPQRIGKHQVAVPSSLTKVIYSSNNNFQKCFSYQNTPPADVSSDKLKDHEVDCSKILN